MAGALCDCAEDLSKKAGDLSPECFGGLSGRLWLEGHGITVMDL